MRTLASELGTDMADVTLDLLGKRLDDLQGEATHYRLVFGVILDEIKALRGRIDLLESRIDLVDKKLNGRLDGLEARMDRLETRVDALDARIMARFDGLEQLLRGKLD